jgi:putative endonuclease
VIDRGAARRRRIGALGEDIAAGFLRRHGCRVLARNLEIGRGEIDLLVSDGRERVVVEVKTVTAAAGRAGSDVVDEAKDGRLRTLARQLDPPVHRIDIVEVLLDESGARARWLRWV